MGGFKWGKRERRKWTFGIMKLERVEGLLERGNRREGEKKRE